MEELKETKEEVVENSNTSEENAEQKEETFTKLEGIKERRSEGILKSVLRDNGSSDEEIKSLMADYKAWTANKASKSKKEVDDLKSENERLKNTLLSIELKDNVNELSNTLGFNVKYADQILKLADMKEVVVNGSVNKEKLSSAISKVIDECDVFKVAKQENDNSEKKEFVNFGAKKETDKINDFDAKLKKAMGINK